MSALYIQSVELHIIYLNIWTILTDLLQVYQGSSLTRISVQLGAGGGSGFGHVDGSNFGAISEVPFTSEAMRVRVLCQDVVARMSCWLAECHSHRMKHDTLAITWLAHD